MNISQRKLLDLPGAYSVAILSLDGRMYYAAASENRGGKAYIVDAETFECSLLWEDGDAGVMNIIQIPGENRLLCITKFYPVFQSRDAEICLLELSESGPLSPWKKTTVMHLPYCHRIGVFCNESGKFLVACTLCKDKEHEQDWSKAGAVYFSPIGSWEPLMQYEGLTKNHGLCIDGTSVYVSAEEGVFKFDCASCRKGDVMRPVMISKAPTGDISVSEKYFAAIEPFHGDSAVVYDKDYRKVREDRLDFGHVIWTGAIGARSYAIQGSRGGEKELVMREIPGGEAIVLDKGVGPAQIAVALREESAIILAANHGRGEVCLYEIAE